MKNFNWGHGLTIVIILLLVLIIAFVIRVSSENIQLVTEEYYESEHEFQDRIQRINNLNKLGAKVTYRFGSDYIEFTFPEGSYSDISKGIIHFYKPSDKNQDKDFQLNINELGRQQINTNDMVKGKYKIFIEWSAEKEYFQQFELTIP